ncbi:MAG TPA: universal stress protein [Stellaceae bacterium]|nr:universal stress protein [Stellaceae bacterium]
MRILVPIDGSAPSLRAVEHAIGLVGGRAGSEIILLNVQGPETLDVSDFAAVVTAQADRARAARQSKAALRKAVARCGQANARFTVRAEIGPVAETIAELARRLEVDQIVIGSRGLGALGRLFLGSVATKVARLVRVPVTLVK